MNLSEIYTAGKLRAAVLNTFKIANTQWIEITAASFSSGFTDKLVMRIRVDKNDFYRTMNLDDNMPPKDYIELSVSALASDEEMQAFWRLVDTMHAETRDEAIERRLKALESK